MWRRGSDRNVPVLTGVLRLADRVPAVAVAQVVIAAGEAGGDNSEPAKEVEPTELGVLVGCQSSAHTCHIGRRGRRVDVLRLSSFGS